MISPAAALPSRLRSSRISGSGFRYANFSGGAWENVELADSNWSESVLTELRLRCLKLERVDFTGADFFRTCLKGVDLSECTIDHITLSETCAELKGATLDAAQDAVAARILGILIR